MSDIDQWLDGLGLGQYRALFAENAIDDRDVLQHLSEQDLKELGVPLGHRKKLLAAIAALTPASTVDRAPTSPAPGPAAAPPEAERRQLTVMLCDLVDSTALSARLDPEDLREVMRTYQEACAAAVGRFEGHVAKFMGDGVLAYFGYPRAHEDDAERAVRAGLDLVAAVSRLRAPEGDRPLAARVGIATGLVVVGDLVGSGPAQEQAVIGETPNLAARLQALAEPHGVVIGPGTRRLVEGLFELTDLGSHELKGFVIPTQAWRVVRATAEESPFEARHPAGLAPLIGRDQEIALLLERWERARAGEGQVVLLSGEPGIGKSRAVRTLRDRMADDPHTRVTCVCSPYHQTSALHPFIVQIERAAGVAPDDTTGRRLDKLEALLGRGSPESAAEQVSLFAALLSIPAGERYPPLTLSPQQQRERTLKALIDHFTSAAAERPVLMVVEDAHWADPTSLELLEMTIDRIQRRRVLLVVTVRPESTPPWTGHAHVTLLSLNRLSRRQGFAIVQQLTDGKGLPAPVLEQIVAKTDGVPLFVEELTKTVLESGLLKDEGDRYTLVGALPPLAIPATLHDSLMARLDRLAPVKDVAQIGAAIGREFSHELLAQVSTLPSRALEDALDQLVAAELVFRRGAPPQALYVFKHALVQDAAYATLLRSKRHRLHARIAEVLEERFPQTMSANPELLAHHCTEAGLVDKAVEYWGKAGQLAVSRAANAEAMAQIARGLEVLASLPDGPERDRQEVGLQATLGIALMGAKGFPAPETGQAFARARDLSRRVGEATYLPDILHGLGVFHLVRAEVNAAHAIAEDVLAWAEDHRDTAARSAGQQIAAMTSFYRGDLGSARTHQEALIAASDPERSIGQPVLYDWNARIVALSFLSYTLFVLGYPDQALGRSREAFAEAQKLSHPHTLTNPLRTACYLHHFCRERRAVQARAQELVALSTEHDYPYWLAIGTVFRGWAVAEGGGAEEGISELTRGLAAFQATHAVIALPYFLGLLADAYGGAGRAAEGLTVLARARTQVEATGERWFEPELHRMSGELFLSRAGGDDGQAEQSFHQALLSARQQNARAWELRAATSLARLWAGNGERRKAHDVLAPVYGWFTEGFDTADLKEARALLDELA